LEKDHEEIRKSFAYNIIIVLIAEGGDVIMCYNSSRLVTIILPTYNRAIKLKDCISSVLAQTYSNFELIICDDCSTDETGAVVKQFMTSDKRIRYYRNATRKGLPANRNIGICKAKGKYVFFIEDDMVLDPKCVEILMKSLTLLQSKGTKVGGIAPRLVVQRDRGDHKLGILNYALRRDNEKLNVPCKVSKHTGMRYFNFSCEFNDILEVPDIHACSLYPRNVLEETGGYDEKRFKGNFLYEETDLNYRIRKKGYKLYFESRAVLYHRIANEGGCRVDTLRYCYFFMLNHIKFVTKNFGFRSLYMIPCFLILIAFTGVKGAFYRIMNMLRRV
jgi:glycosyltransferase involved in cell wall biosynthesis